MQLFNVKEIFREKWSTETPTALVSDRCKLHFAAAAEQFEAQSEKSIFQLTTKHESSPSMVVSDFGISMIQVECGMKLDFQ